MPVALAYSSLLSPTIVPEPLFYSHSVPRYQGILAPAIPCRDQRYQMRLGVHCPLLLAYVCWLKDAVRDEKQAHQAQGYPEEGILEWAQHQQLKLLPEGSRGLGTRTHRLPTLRRLSSPSLGSWAEAWLPSDTKMAKWMGT